MPRITVERGEEARARVLRAARRVFVEKGIRATTHDVAREAGIAVGSIYTYFENKGELLRASLLAANEDETAAILAEVRLGGTLRERMQRAIRGWYRYTIEAPGVPEFLAEIWAAASRDPLVRDIVARRRERALTVAAMLLREAGARSELTPGLDVDLAARAITALLDGIVLERIGAGEAPRVSDVERRVLLLLAPAVAPRASRKR